MKRLFDEDLDVLVLAFVFGVPFFFVIIKVIQAVLFSLGNS